MKLLRIRTEKFIRSARNCRVHRELGPHIPSKRLWDNLDNSGFEAACGTIPICQNMMRQMSRSLICRIIAQMLLDLLPSSSPCTSSQLPIFRLMSSISTTVQRVDGIAVRMMKRHY